MANAHTPGPWYISPTNWEDCHAGIYSEEANSYLAVIVGTPNSEEDARLIAEAPAMLEALRAIRAKAAECGNDTSAPDHVAALFYDIVEDANDILARIDGEAA